MNTMKPHTLYVMECTRKGMDTTSTFEAVMRKFPKASMTKQRISVIRFRSRNFGFASVKAHVHKTAPALGNSLYGKSFIAIVNAPYGWAEKKTKLNSLHKTFMKALGKNERQHQTMLRTYLGQTSKTASK